MPSDQAIARQDKQAELSEGGETIFKAHVGLSADGENHDEVDACSLRQIGPPLS